MKYKIKRKKKTFKTWYILLVLIIVIILMSSSYSLWQTNLYINATIIGNLDLPELPVVVPSQGTDENGINRFTTNTSMNFAFTEIYRVTAEEYSDNTITTTIKHMYKQWFSSSNPEVTISFDIQNDSDKSFENGKIELIEYNDSNGIFTNLNYSISNVILEQGDRGEVTISGTLRGDKDVSNNTYYNFAIKYEIDNIKYCFYYNIILLPI